MIGKAIIRITVDGEDLRRWIQFIDQECGGWADRPVSAVDEAQEVLEKVLLSYQPLETDTRVSVVSNSSERRT
ncbi:hypothetical protein [Natrinema salaciae]|uniref:Uncharacterized protein n=1 Tax=Natrinema salaciae TaxID=1186196 RepID=A0A1H9CGX6_9EURY|nr:hypothetical protein [Natrinema salaciae]SEQ00465.1 hypothetical protein SAMN04489841_1051 [Natrinema salaciae]